MAVFRVAASHQDQFSGVTPALMSILQRAAAMMPANVSVVEAFSGKTGRSTGTRNHPAGRAVDVRLYDANGNPIKDYFGGQKSFSAADQAAYQTYEQFAQAARAAQEQMYPELSGAFRWGGYFQGGVNPLDAMHFDLSGGLSNATPPQTARWQNGLESLPRISLGVAALPADTTNVAQGPDMGQLDSLTRLAGYAPAPEATPAQQAITSEAQSVPIVASPQSVAMEDVPQGPFGANNIIVAAMNGDVPGVRQALGDVGKQMLQSPNGLVGAINDLRAYTDSISQNFPSVMRAVQSSLDQSPDMASAVPGPIRSQFSRSASNLPSVPTPSARPTMAAAAPADTYRSAPRTEYAAASPAAMTTQQPTFRASPMMAPPTFGGLMNFSAVNTAPVKTEAPKDTLQGLANAGFVVPGMFPTNPTVTLQSALASNPPAARPAAAPAIKPPMPITPAQTPKVSAGLFGTSIFPTMATAGSQSVYTTPSGRSFDVSPGNHGSYMVSSGGTIQSPSEYLGSIRGGSAHYW